MHYFLLYIYCWSGSIMNKTWQLIVNCIGLTGIQVGMLARCRSKSALPKIKFRVKKSPPEGVNSTISKMHQKASNMDSIQSLSKHKQNTK